MRLRKRTKLFRKKISLGAKSNFLAGILIVVPVIFSVWIGWKLYDLLTSWGLALAGELHLTTHLSPFWQEQSIRALSLLCILMILIFVGMLTKITLGNRLIVLTQYLMMKVPIINFVYSTCKQIADAMYSSRGGNMFQQVVLFEYPRKGSWTIGFLTNRLPDDFEIAQKLGENTVTVFVPTTPNPTSGFLFMLPQKDIIPLQMSIADAMKFIVGCGGVLPADKTDELKKNA